MIQLIERHIHVCLLIINDLLNYLLVFWKEVSTHIEHLLKTARDARVWHIGHFVIIKLRIGSVLQVFFSEVVSCLKRVQRLSQQLVDFIFWLDGLGVEDIEDLLAY